MVINDKIKHTVITKQKEKKVLLLCIELTETFDYV